MKQLNDTELDQRIHKFLRRKWAEFPELTDDDVRPGQKWPGKPLRFGHHPHKLAGGTSR